jgi:hypothetical protein
VIENLEKKVPNTRDSTEKMAQVRLAVAEKISKMVTANLEKKKEEEKPKEEAPAEEEKKEPEPQYEEIVVGVDFDDYFGGVKMAGGKKQARAVEKINAATQ